MFKTYMKKIVIWLNVFLLIIFSGCSKTIVNKGEIYEDDITAFYNNNVDLLNNAVKEYTANTNGKVITIFFIENLVLDEFEELSKSDSDIVIWEPEAKINHTTTISKYENCVKTLHQMKDYMLKHNFKQVNDDYVINITTYGLNNDFTVDNTDSPYVILFDFTDVKSNVSYHLVHTETELTSEFTKIDTNWYIEVRYGV